VKQNDTILLVLKDNVVVNFKIWMSFYHKYTFLLGFLNSIESNGSSVRSSPTHGDVSSEIFDQVIGDDFGIAIFFDQNSLIVVLLNEIAHW
jgi:hypothetical protein